MKQLGNLSMVCAQRPEVSMTLYNGTVTVHVGSGPQRRALAQSGMMTRRFPALSLP